MSSFNSNMIKHFGLYLLEKNLINRSLLVEALKYQEQSNSKLGEICEKKGWLSKSQIEHIFEIQRKTQSKFGEIAISEGLLQKDEIEDLLIIQKDEFIDLKKALIHVGGLNEEKIATEEREYLEKQSNLKESLSTLPKDLPFKDFFQEVVEQSKEMLTQMLQTRFLIAECSSRDQKIESLPGYSAYMRFTGAPSFDYNFVISTVLATILVNKFWGIDTKEINEEVRKDGIAEILNIIAGSIVNVLTDQGHQVEMGLPKITKNQIHWSGPKDKYYLDCNFISSSGVLDILIGVDE